jgi:hypothetical protein
VPCVASLDAFHEAVAGFEVEDLGLVIEPAALAAAGRSLDSAGLLLLGEIHGVRENPLLIRALMQAFGLTRLALEWPEDLAPVIRAFLAGQPPADHRWLWGGDGRITAGHLAVLAERHAAGPLEVILFDGVSGAGWSWSQRDAAMARRLLAGSPATARTLAVAGNAHTATSPTDLGVPLGACLARQRPGIQQIRISYGGGASGISSHANSSAGPARRGRYGYTRTPASWSWTCLRPRRRSCPSDRSHRRRLRANHPKWGIMPTTRNRTALRPWHMPDPAGDPGTASAAWRLTITVSVMTTVRGDL